MILFASRLLPLIFPFPLSPCPATLPLPHNSVQQYLSYTRLDIKSLQASTTCHNDGNPPGGTLVLREDNAVHEMAMARELDPVPFADEAYMIFPNSLKRPFYMNAATDPTYSCQAAMKKLNECRAAQVQNVVFSSQRGQDVVVSTGASPKVNRIALMIHPTLDPNAYHALAYDSTPYCVFRFIRDLEEGTLVDLWTENENAMDLLRALATGEVFTVDSGLSSNQIEYKYDKIFEFAKSIDSNVVGGQPDWNLMLKASYKISQFPLWPSHSFLRETNSCEFGIGFSAAVKERLAVRDHNSREGEVVLLVRTGDSRRLGGLETGTLEEVVAELVRRKIRVSVVSFDEGTSFQEVVTKVASAAIFVGVHGAVLIHSAWLKPGTTLLEVISRGSELYKEIYLKSDFANLSRFFGARYLYYDAESSVITDKRLKIVQNAKGTKYEGGGNIEIRITKALVDATKFADAIECELKRFN
ncbi:hypothetical protein TrVE_jg10816 [Triparma verrucosa]|uniref:Glycosyltransferase 61 catalytic domain-containing protein n=1 Tax=Triparma verrucosa TaxID=1606542 RepID=A0A9W7BQQ0_9STRA|nr:hypothetical protein TrVE_jg10816 [Triparma verrucosa]